MFVKVYYLKSKKALDALIGSKVGDTVKLKSKGLFKEDYLTSSAFGVSQDKAEGLDIEAEFLQAAIEIPEFLSKLKSYFLVP